MNKGETEMDKRAWVHQLKAQVEKQGADAASWYVSWTDPNGKQCRKSCGPGKVGKLAANRLADTTHSQLVTGTYQAQQRATWDQFFERYAAHIEGRYDAPSRNAAMLSLKTFARVAKPKLMKSYRHGTSRRIYREATQRDQHTPDSRRQDSHRLACDRQPRVEICQSGDAADWG